jgi:hypothetical protein
MRLESLRYGDVITLITKTRSGRNCSLIFRQVVVVIKLPTAPGGIGHKGRPTEKKGLPLRSAHTGGKPRFHVALERVSYWWRRNGSI